MDGAIRGQVILLNGALSSGKSSVGRALQELLPDPWFLMSVDGFGAMRSTPQTRGLGEAGTDGVLRRTRMGYHRAVAAMASVGNDVIMDYPLSEGWRLDDLLEVLVGLDVRLVDVRCSVDELDRRERARGDRPRGLARSQNVFAHDDCDIVFDTTSVSARQCAADISEQLRGRDGEKAFDRLRRRRSPPT